MLPSVQPSRNNFSTTIVTWKTCGLERKALTKKIDIAIMTKALWWPNMVQPGRAVRLKGPLTLLL